MPLVAFDRGEMKGQHLWEEEQQGRREKKGNDKEGENAIATATATATAFYFNFLIFWLDWDFG